MLFFVLSLVSLYVHSLPVLRESQGTKPYLEFFNSIVEAEAHVGLSSDFSDQDRLLAAKHHQWGRRRETLASLPGLRPPRLCERRGLSERCRGLAACVGQWLFTSAKAFSLVQLVASARTQMALGSRRCLKTMMPDVGAFRRELSVPSSKDPKSPRGSPGL